MAKCLVLGANGFIGSHLVDSLAKDGNFVRCFDRYKSDNYLFNESLSSNIEIFSGDFLNRTSLEQALEGIDYVFHFISTTNPSISENDPFIDIDTNIRMSVELFSLCVKKNIKRVIFASTGGAIYGNTNTSEPISENHNTNPFSPYAIGKLTIENYLNYFHKRHGLKGTVIRISNPYGPRQNILSGQGVMSIFLNKIRLNEPINIFGNGNMIRDYIFIDDLISMIKPFIETEPSGKVYNIGSGKGHSVNELVKIIENVTNQNIRKVFLPQPDTYVDSIVLDNTKYKNEFGLPDFTNITTGIKNMWKYIEEEYGDKK